MNQLKWTLMRVEAPPKDLLVWCLREWTPLHLGNDGSVRHEILLAKRASNAPPTIEDDASRNCFWGDAHTELRSWADSTVLAWAPVEAPDLESELAFIKSQIEVTP